MKISNRLYISVRCIIGAIFIYAGTAKLSDPKVFATLIDAYGIVPDIMVMPAALVLIFLEILAGAGLIFDVRGSLAAVVTLLVMFILVLGYGISMGLDIDCGCFGHGDPEAKAYHGLRTTLNRDMIILAACIYIYMWRRIKKIKPLSLPLCLKKYFQKEKFKCDVNYFQ